MNDAATMPDLSHLGAALLAAAVVIVIPHPFIRAWIEMSNAARRISRVVPVAAAMFVLLLVTVLVLLVVPDELMDVRQEHMAQAIRGWHSTGAVLTFVGASGFQVLTDDPGAYLLAPLFHRLELPPEALGRALGHIGRVTLLALMLVTLCRYRAEWTRRPLAYALLGACCGVAAALGVRVSQQYWCPVAVAWGGALLVSPPPMRQAEARRSLRAAAAIVGYAVFVLACALMRESAALVGAAALLALAAERCERVSTRALAAIVALAMLIAPAVVTNALFAMRDRTLMRAGVEAPALRGAHPRWHNIYAGLAVPASPLGLTYADSTTMRAVSIRNPEVVYPSVEYDREARALVAELSREHPWLVARQFLAKAAIMLAIVVVIWAPLVARARGVADGVLMTSLARYLPLIVAGLLPAILVIPIVPYGAAGICGALVSLGCAAIALTPSARADRERGAVAA